jgi:maleate isomerase
MERIHSNATTWGVAMPTKSVTASSTAGQPTLSYCLDAGVGWRAAIGLLVLATDQTIEYEWRRLLNLDGVAFFVNRIANAATVTPENLRAMEADLTSAAALILPEIPLDVIAYGCTSAAVFIGEDTVTRRILMGRAEAVKVTTPITAAKAACRALGKNRIALLTPYIEAINQRIQAHLEDAGLEVPIMRSFDNSDDNMVMRIAPASILAAARDLGSDSAVEMVFIACTSLRGAALVEELEAQLNKPVTTSCHAMAWHALRLAGYRDPVAGQGQLFRC